MQILLTVGLIGAGGWQANSSWASYGGGATKPELYGIWNVERLMVDNEVRQPMLTDVDYIKRIIFDRASSAAIQLPDGSIFKYTAEFDAKSQTTTLKRFGENVQFDGRPEGGGALMGCESIPDESGVGYGHGDILYRVYADRGGFRNGVRRDDDCGNRPNGR